MKLGYVVGIAMWVFGYALWYTGLTNVFSFGDGTTVLASLGWPNIPFGDSGNVGPGAGAFVQKGQQLIPGAQGNTPQSTPAAPPTFQST